MIDKLDPGYTGYQAKNNKAPDDIGIGLWGLVKTVRLMSMRPSRR